MDPQRHPLTNGARPDDEIHLRDVWNLLVRNWLIIAAALVLSVGVAAAYTVWAVPVYESATSIRVEEERTDLPVLDVLQTLSTGSEVETEMEVVRSRTIAEDVVETLGLQLVVTKPRGVARVDLMDSASVLSERWAPEGTYVLERRSDGSFSITDQQEGTSLGTASSSAAAVLPGATFRLTAAAVSYPEIVVQVKTFERAVEDLQAAITVARPNREASIITVRFQSSDTQFVHSVPNLIAARFIERGKAIRKTEARSTVAFLTQQIDTVGRQLTGAEQALQDFRETEQVVSIQAEADAQVEQLSQLQADRNTIEAERDALAKLVTEIDGEAATADPGGPSPYARLISFPTLFRNQAAGELLRALNEANAQRAQLLRQRTTQDPDVVAVADRIHQIETQLRSTAMTYLQGLENQVAGYDRMLTRFSSDLERIPGKEIQLARLARQQKVLEEIYTLLQNRLQEARILEAVDDPTVRTVDPAILPSEPVKPRTMLNLLLGLVLGGMLGVGIAFLREYMDETVHTRDDVQAAAQGAPVLGMIPRIRTVGANGRGADAAVPGGLGARLVAGRDPRNPVSEAYRSLRTNLTFANLERPPRTIVFTSALPQDGKSTSAANLSITLAQQGIRTLLVDADLRRGVLHSVFGVEREPGLTNALMGGRDVVEVIRRLDLGESGTLDFLPSGPYPPNPAEVLGSQRMRALIEKVEKIYDLVVVDSAPLTAVTDAAVLGTKADGVVIVARANVTERGALTYAVQQLQSVRAPILGCILNDVDYRRDSRYYSAYGKYGYYYAYYYADDVKRRRKSEAGRGPSRVSPS